MDKLRHNIHITHSDMFLSTSGRCVQELLVK
jgi:hypothetical protein